MIDTVICPSRFMEQKLSVHPDLRGKTVVIHNFVELFSEDVFEKQNYVLYFGRYCEEKGTPTLLEVCRKLPEIPFVFAGGGPLKEEVAQVKNITDKGFLKGRELAETIGSARFFVFPSEWYENCPFAVLEAQAYGTPVLASNLGGTPELVQNHITGEIFTGGNADELLEKIQRLWNNRSLLEQYTVNCRKAKFETAKEYCVSLVKIYRGEAVL